MTYEETIDWLYKQLPMFSRIGAAAYKEDLHNTITLCNSLDNPQLNFNSIHVAGTNGKGSISHMLAAILQQAGYKTGLYTSPHIKDFRERIRINGVMIKRDYVVDFVERTKQITEQIKPSFFELTVAMAFDYFSNRDVDIAVIETGLGGRLDSTNIITPLLSVISNIGLDHTNILGNTLAAIAYEKAGIIKQEVPVVIGEVIPETQNVFESKALNMLAPIHFVAENIVPETIENHGTLMQVKVRNLKNNIVENIALDLQGHYQAKNLCTVLTTVELLKEQGFSISNIAIHQALKNVQTITGLAGRWEIVQTDPTVILDVAHNFDGITEVLKQLKTSYPSSALHFVLGFVTDKDVNNILALFPPSEKYYFTNAHIPRALNFKILQDHARQFNLQGEGFDDVNHAIAAARQHAQPGDVVMVCGSFFIIAEVNT